MSTSTTHSIVVTDRTRIAINFVARSSVIIKKRMRVYRLSTPHYSRITSNAISLKGHRQHYRARIDCDQA